MKKYGAGSITFERGRYRLRLPDGKGKHRGAGRTFASEQEAERMRDAVAFERGEFPVGGMLLDAYGELVIGRWARAGLRDIKSTRSRWSVLVARAPFARTPIASLMRAEVRDWVRSLPKQLSARGLPLSWQSQKHALGLLCRVLDEAREDGLIEVNPARGVRLQRRQDRDEGWTWLTLDELDVVFALPLSDEQRAVLVVAVYQGLRQGELAALRWENVDFAAGWLVIAGSWNTATKSGRVRRIPLLPRAAAALVAWQPKESKRLGLVFPGADGRAYARGYDWGWGERRGKVKDIPTRAGIERRVRFHDLRHTCAAHLVSGSWGSPWRLREVRDFLGHTSEAVTERYAHLAPDALHARAQATAVERPAANLPQGVSSAAVQLLDFIQQAVRGSNARPSAPEYSGSATIATGYAADRQVRGRSYREAALALAEAAANNRPTTQTEIDAVALCALAEPKTLLALEALAGGPRALSRALEMIELDDADAATGRVEADGSGRP